MRRSRTIEDDDEARDSRKAFMDDIVALSYHRITSALAVVLTPPFILLFFCLQNRWFVDFSTLQEIYVARIISHRRVY